MDERRRYPRFKMGVEIQWKRISSTERTARHISHTKDVSTGGVCLVLHEGVVVGDVLEISIHSPVSDPLELRGQVVWIDPKTRIPNRTEPICEGGVSFIGLTPEQTTLLEKLISRTLMNRGRK